MICSKDILSIRSELDQNIGQKIIVKGTLGRNKSFEQEAIIQKTYPNVFGVSFKERNVSYKYTDILTNELQVSIFNGKEYSPLIPVLSKNKF